MHHQMAVLLPPETTMPQGAMDKAHALWPWPAASTNSLLAEGLCALPQNHRLVKSLPAGGRVQCHVITSWSKRQCTIGVPGVETFSGMGIRHVVGTSPMCSAC